MHTTLNRIRQRNPCKDGWETLLGHLGKTGPDDEPLPLLTILDAVGFEHTLWCFRAVDAVDGFEKEKQLLAITYARDVEHLMTAESKKALDVFERYANGLATKKEFEAARRAAADAAEAAWGADASYAAAARAAAHAAAAVAYAAWTVARDAWFASAAAYAAAYDAAAAADADAADAAAAADAARAARAAAAACAAVDAVDAARSTIKAKQEAQLRGLLEKTK